MDYTAIIAFSLFAASEVLAVLPIPANGFLQSLFIGLKNTLQKNNNELKIAQGIVTSKPEIAEIIHQVATSKPLSDAITHLTEHPQVIPQVDALCSNPTLCYIITVLQNNPQLTANISQILEHNMSKFDPSVMV